jgi:hypothetical protein
MLAPEIIQPLMNGVAGHQGLVLDRLFSSIYESPASSLKSAIGETRRILIGWQ